MGGHLASIGFGGEQWQPAVMEASSRSRLAGKDERGVEHFLWQDPSGARVTYHAKGGDLLCLTPGFRPESPTTWDVESSAPLLDPDCLDCSGADLDILDGRGELVTRAALQFELFAPWQAWLTTQRRWRLEVGGFVHWGHACRNEAELHRAFKERGIGDAKLAPTAFVPVGMFSTEPKGVTERATALLTGSIESIEHRVNQHTEAEFLWLRVSTLPGPLDLAAALGSVAGELQPGRTIFTEVWLSGRPAERMKGWEL